VTSLSGLLAVLVLAGTFVESIEADGPNEPKGGQAMNVMVDVNPAQPPQGTTLVSSLSPLLRTIGQPQWSPVRLQGIMGHAFQFEMKEGGRWVYHDNMDWGLALDVLGDIAKFQEFHATKKEAEAAVDLITAARSVKGFTAEDRAEAGRLIGAAQQAEKAAIAKIEAARMS
jgi:hypothetical protein